MIYGALSRSASRRRWGGLTGRNPVDRGKPGSKLHVLIDRTGLPLAVAGQHCNTHDSLALIPLAQAIGVIRWMWAPGGAGQPAGPLLTTALCLPHLAELPERVVHAKELS